MKMLNNTTGRVWFDTTFEIDGKSGGDCGWIEPNSPPHDYPIPAGMTNLTVTMRVEGITYTDLTDETFVQVQSSALEPPSR
jgi:hypothetical protein